jgi:hypothetical protein
MQQHHLASHDAEDHPPDLAIRQIAADLPKAMT